MDVFGNGDITSVLEVCNSFSRNPASFLAARGVEMDSFVQQSVVFMAAETRDDAPKIQVLLLWQQHVHVLFTDSKRFFLLFFFFFFCSFQGSIPDSKILILLLFLSFFLSFFLLVESASLIGLSPFTPR